MNSTARINYRINHSSACDASTFLKTEEKPKFSLIDNINSAKLGLYYHKDDSIFKKKIDKLSLRFYLETEKVLTIKTDLEKCQDNLFLILFRQVSLYVEEIERLNLKLREKEENEKHTKQKIDEMSKKEVFDNDMNYYKTTIRNLEKKINDKIINEEKLKRENDSYKRQVIFFKDKLKLDMSTDYKKKYYYKSQLDKFKSTKTNTLTKVTNTDNEFGINLMSLTGDVNNFMPNNHANNDQLEFLRLSSGTSTRTAKNTKYNYFNINTNTTIKRELSPPLSKKRRNISAFSGSRNDKDNGKGDNYNHNERTIMGSKNSTNKSVISVNRSYMNDNINKVNNPNQSIKPLKKININKKLNKSAIIIKDKDKNSNNIINNNYQNIYTVNITHPSTAIEYNNKEVNEQGENEKSENNEINNNTNNNVIQFNTEQLNDFAAVFRNLFNEELELLNKEEEVLRYLKNDLLIDTSLTASMNNLILNDGNINDMEDIMLSEKNVEKNDKLIVISDIEEVDEKKEISIASDSKKKENQNVKNRIRVNRKNFK